MLDLVLVLVRGRRADDALEPPGAREGLDRLRRGEAVLEPGGDERVGVDGPAVAEEAQHLGRDVDDPQQPHRRGRAAR